MCMDCWDIYCHFPSSFSMTCKIKKKRLGKSTCFLQAAITTCFIRLLSYATSSIISWAVWNKDGRKRLWRERLFKSEKKMHTCHIKFHLILLPTLQLPSVTISNIWLIGLVGRVFANGRGNRGSILGRIISKTLKWYLMPPCLTLSIIRYLLMIKSNNIGEGLAPSPTTLCSSYWKGSLPVALDYCCQLLFQQVQLRSTICFRKQWGGNFVHPL